MKKNNQYLYKFIVLISILVFSSEAFSLCTVENNSNYEEILKRAVKSGITGTTFYYQKDLCVIHLAAGYSDLKTKKEMKKNDRFLIGSITKLFIGVTSVKLADSGIFNLDDNLDQWLPIDITDHIPHSNLITIRHLLSHTSGLFDYLNDSPAFIQILLSNPTINRTELEAFAFAADKPLHFTPGTEYRYSNTNYLLMGLIINAATNEHYTQLIRELILTPLELNNTFHLSEPQGSYLPYTRGYEESNGILYDTHDLVQNMAFADGGMVSTTSDLRIFIQSIFNDKQFMNSNLLETLLNSPITNSEYGLGIFMDKEDKIYFGHNGQHLGYLASLKYYPDSNETIVILENTNIPTSFNLFTNTYHLELIRERIQSQQSLILSPNNSFPK